MVNGQIHVPGALLSWKTLLLPINTWFWLWRRQKSLKLSGKRSTIPQMYNSCICVCVCVCVCVCIRACERVFSYFPLLVVMCGNWTLERHDSRSQWPSSLRRRSAAARLQRLWVRIPPGVGMSVCCDCCMLSGRGLWVGLITSPEESYRLWCVVLCDLETSWLRRP